MNNEGHLQDGGGGGGGGGEGAEKKCCTMCALGVYCKEMSENMTFFTR